MITLQLNNNNDLQLNNINNISLAKDIYAVEQSCKNATMALLGEMIFNTDKGIPYFETVWNGNPQIQQAEFEIRSAILDVEGVKNIKDFSIFVKNGVLSYNTTIETIYGEVAYGV